MTATNLSTSSTTSSQSLLAALSLMKGVWDTAQTSYVEHFKPLVLDCLRQHSVPVPPMQVRDEVAERFALSLPAGVVQHLLDGAAEQGRASGREGKYYIPPHLPNPEDLSRASNEAQRRHRSLADRFVNWVYEEHGVELGEDQAYDLLLGYIETRPVPLLRAVVHSEGPQDAELQEDEQHYLVAEFVSHLCERDADGFTILEELIKASMVATTLYWGDFELDSAAFEGVEFYLDTPFLLAVLGYEGTDQEGAALEV